MHWQLNCGASRFVNTVALVDLAAAQPQEQQFVSGSAAKKQAPVRPERGGAGAAKSGGGAAAPAQRMEDSAAPSPVSNIVKQLQRSLSKNGRTTVWLKLDVPKIDSNFICSPSLLTVNGNSGAIITENGVLRQINTEDAFTDISVVVTGKKFRVRSWNRAAWTPGGLPPSGFWQLPNEISYPPTSDTLFENPDATSAGRLKITTISRMGSATDTSMVLYTETFAPDHRLIAEEYDGDAVIPAKLLRRSTLDYVPTNAWQQILVRTVEEASSTTGVLGPLVMVSKEREEYRDFSINSPGEPNALRLVSVTRGWNSTAPRTSTFEYYSDTAVPKDPRKHGRIKSVLHPDQSWEFYTYTFSNSLIKMTRYASWLDLPLLTEAPAEPYAGLKEETTTVSGTAELKRFIGGDLVAKQEFVQLLPSQASGFVTLKERNFDGSAWQETVTRSWPHDTSDKQKAGRIDSVVRSDGTGETWTYSTNPAFLGRRTTVRRGACTVTGDVVAVTSGQEVTTDYNLAGKTVEVITKEITGPSSTLLMDQWTGSAFDSSGNPTIINFLSGDVETRIYACCGLTSSTSRDKIVTLYERDQLKRVWRTTTTFPGGGSDPVVDTTTFNGLTTTRARTCGAVSYQLSKQTSHLNGEPLSSESPDADGNGVPETTTYALPVVAGGGAGWIFSSTAPDLATTIRQTYLDGQLKSISGTAVADTSYSYGVSGTLLFGDLKATTSKVTRLTSTGGTAEWSETIYDPLGRPVRNVLPGTTAYAVTSYYPPTSSAGSRGRVQSTTDADGVTRSYTYDNRGRLSTTTSPHPGGTRVDSITQDVVGPTPPVTLKGITLGPAYRTVRSLNGTVTGTSYRSGDGLRSGSASFGRESATARTVPDPNGAWSVTAIAADGTSSVSLYAKGGLEQTSQFLTAAPATVVVSTTTVRNSLGRLLSSTNSRTGTTTYSNYTAAGQARTVTLPGARVTSYTFDVMDRPLSVDAPDTAIAGGTSANITYTSYYPTGLIKAQWGDQTNAAFYLYDEQNRMTGLRTYRSLAIGTEPLLATTGFDSTTWLYDPDRGWLTGKRDAANLRVTYTYTDTGRLRTRQWARGAWTRYDYHPASGVQTATRYFTAATGSAAVLAASAGNDPDTADTSFTFDSLGRLDTASTFLGSAPSVILTSNKFYYTANFTLDKEDITMDPDGSGPIPALTRTLDRKEDSLHRSTGWDLKNGATTEHGNTYTYHATEGRLDTVTGSAGTFTYGYTPDTYHLTATVTGPAHTVTNTWLPDRDALDLKENKVGTTNLSTYDYSVNALSQRDSVEASGTAFGTAVDTTDWAYDALGQVVSADHPVIAKNFGYQYDGMGNRQKSSRNTSNINTSVLANQGRYHEGTTGMSALGGNVLNQNLYQVNSNAGAINQYDADGNQTEGLLPVSAPYTAVTGTRTWDGENRLIGVNRSGTIHIYTYDAFHRRVGKRSGTSDASMTVYDGWNPIADYDHTTSITLHSSYTWGRDLSGSLQGAGGVGGLLAVQRHSPATSPGTFYPTYDGNGNISEYLTSTGTVASHYEYGPFGELTTATGPQANLFTHRFSTKPLDAETGYYYYGYRFYDPLGGRWAGRDPVEEQGGKNLYGMLRNNPILHTDYLGNCQIEVIDPRYDLTGSPTNPDSAIENEDVPMKPGTSANAQYQDQNGLPTDNPASIDCKCENFKISCKMTINQPVINYAPEKWKSDPEKQNGFGRPVPWNDAEREGTRNHEKMHINAELNRLHKMASEFENRTDCKCCPGKNDSNLNDGMSDYSDYQKRHGSIPRFIPPIKPDRYTPASGEDYPAIPPHLIVPPFSLVGF